jgi:hypothetical protein
MTGRDELGERVCERALVWHLGHFRVSDQPALSAAATEARTVFPVVVRDASDPLSALAGYGAAVRALEQGYRELGAYLTYLEGEAAMRVIDAARDARADYVYVLSREDPAGASLLSAVAEELELWGFKSRIFSGALTDTSGRMRELAPKPASLSGHPLPGQALPPGPAWGEREAELLTAGHAPDHLLDHALALGLLSARQLWELRPRLEEVKG